MDTKVLAREGRCTAPTCGVRNVVCVGLVANAGEICVVKITGGTSEESGVMTKGVDVEWTVEDDGV